MKKLLVLVLTLVFILALSGCNNEDQEQVLTYSFSGGHEYFSLSNGSIILSDKEEVFDGGVLEITQSGFFEEISSYSTTFYTLINGKRRIILSDSVFNKSGAAVSVDGALGSISGKGVIIGKKASNIDELKEALWFELKTVNLNGEENTYQTQLTFTE